MPVGRQKSAAFLKQQLTFPTPKASKRRRYTTLSERVPSANLPSTLVALEYFLGSEVRSRRSSWPFSRGGKAAAVPNFRSYYVQDCREEIIW